MRLAFLAPEFSPAIGGAGIYSIYLIKALSEHEDMDIHVFTPARGEDYDQEKVLNYFGHRIKLHNISNAHDDFVYNFTFQYKVFRELPRYHNQYNYDLIHSANLVNMPDIYLKFKPLGIPSVATVHTTIKAQVTAFLDATKNFRYLAPSERWSLATYPYISLMERIYLRRTEHMITVSRRFAKMLQERYRYRGVIEPIHNGIDLEVFDYQRVNDPYQRFPQLNGERPVVLYAGRLIARKGLNVFVQAINQLRDTEAHFVFAGGGQEKLLFELLERYQIPKERYTFLGFVPNDQLPWLYKLSSMFVLPSFYENLPFSLLEAMAMKVPCIASNVGAVSEVIQAGENGLLFEVGDVKALVSHVRLLLENGAQRARLAEAGFRRVTTEFTSARMAKEHRQFYEKVMTSARD
ncbi:MAG: glycosyltransferase family 4 protein [Dehalococcoidia bacterium]